MTAIPWSCYICVEDNPWQIVENLINKLHQTCIVSVGVTPYWYGGDLNEIVCGPGRITKSDTENVVDRILVEEFGFDYEDVDSVQNYGSLDRIIKTYGFIFGSKAISYLKENNKTTIQWRNRVHFKYVQ